MQKSMLKNSVFNIIYTASNILFPFITSIYVSRILLPVGVGKVASAQNIASYFVTAAALGLPSYGVREFAKVREDQYTQQPFIHPPHHTHPEERIWAGRTPRVPDAPRIKHDKMKQFYMVDMRRKRW